LKKVETPGDESVERNGWWGWEGFSYYLTPENSEDCAALRAGGTLLILPDESGALSIGERWRIEEAA
jgi:hypothetical protein